MRFLLGSNLWPWLDLDHDAFSIFLCFSKLTCGPNWNLTLMQCFWKKGFIQLKQRLDLGAYHLLIFFGRVYSYNCTLPLQIFRACQVLLLIDIDINWLILIHILVAIEFNIKKWWLYHCCQNSSASTWPLPSVHWALSSMMIEWRKSLAWAGNHFYRDAISQSARYFWEYRWLQCTRDFVHVKNMALCYVPSSCQKHGSSMLRKPDKWAVSLIKGSEPSKRVVPHY